MRIMGLRIARRSRLPISIRECATEMGSGPARSVLAWRVLLTCFATRCRLAVGLGSLVLAVAGLGALASPAGANCVPFCLDRPVFTTNPPASAAAGSDFSVSVSAGEAA